MVNSGSSAIKLAIEVLDLAPGDEIVTPAVTFGTDVAPIVQAGLVPAFVDVDPTTFQVDASGIEEMVGSAHPRRCSSRTSSATAPTGIPCAPVADAHGLVGDRGLLRRARLVAARPPHRRAGRHQRHQLRPRPRDHRGGQRRHGGAARRGAARPVPDAAALGSAIRDLPVRLAARGRRDRHGPLADGTPYDLTFQFELVGYNFEPSEIGAAYALVQLDKLADYNGRRQHNWNRLHELDGRRTRSCSSVRRRIRDTRTTWMRYPFLLREGVDRAELQRAAGRPRHRELHGVERQHPASPRLRGHRVPGARATGCPTPTRSRARA